jgi:hypothetical protein
MKFFRLLCILLLAVLISAAFLACSKENAVKAEATSPGSSKDPATQGSTPIEGIWMGKYFGYNKSIPIYLGFALKGKGKLDVLNDSKQLIGAGSWQLNGAGFKATFIISISKESYSVYADLQSSATRLAGTWGYDGSSINGGYWDMIKAD